MEKALEVITKDMMVQYKKIHQSGLCDMFDHPHVTRTAHNVEFYALASLTRKDYALLLQNFNSLMKHYGIEQE
jgi:hypothetical protein